MRCPFQESLERLQATQADAIVVERLGSGTTTKLTAAPPAGRPESQSARIVRLEAELAESKAERVKLETERDILRQAAKYFAGETNW